MTEIKVRKEYMNDDLELTKRRGYGVGKVFYHTFPKGTEGRGKIMFKYSYTPTLFPEPIILVLINWFRNLRFPDLIIGFGES